MKKAVYYARVSTSLQEEQGTIESQKSELVKQIKKDGNILVREYIDNGWSGGRLDRPALDELRRDIKDNLFEVVYFLDSDRIARDVTYQNIIIAELLKYNKDIIIKGKNYIHNSENKFTLTVMGAVNELEKAKIVERFMRGRRERARQGAIVDSGGLYGYDHIKKTDIKRGSYEVNEEQAKVIKLIFETYVNVNTSLNEICKLLESKSIKTATGKNYWKSSVVRRMLTNTSYYGVHYFNKTTKVESKNGVKKYSKNVKTTSVLKNEEEWIEVPIPAIITKELFDLVQVKLKRNAKLLRNTNNKYLLGGMIKCGYCSHTYSGVTWKGDQYYRCNYRDKLYQHINKDELASCSNQSIKGEHIDEIVSGVILDKILQPAVIKKHIDILKSTKRESLKKIDRDLIVNERQIQTLEGKKKRVLDLYSDGALDKGSYVEKINELEQKNNELQNENNILSKKKYMLQQSKEVRKNISYFCRLARTRYEKLNQSERIIFTRNLIDEVVLFKNESDKKLVIRGVLPALKEKVSSIPHYHTLHGRGFGRRRHVPEAGRGFTISSGSIIP